MTPDTHKANYCQVGPHEIRKLLTVKEAEKQSKRQLTSRGTIFTFSAATEN